MRHLSKVLLILVTVLLVINISIHSVEGGRVLIIKEGINLYLESSLKGMKPPSPNPTEPSSTINQRNFAGGRTKFLPHHPPAPTEPRYGSA